MSESYWWCPNCREEVDGHHVTYQEQHEACGHLVESITPEKQERIAELEDEMRFLNKERNSYLSQALNHGITIIKLKEDMKELEAALQKETEAADFGLNRLEAELAKARLELAQEAEADIGIQEMFAKVEEDNTRLEAELASQETKQSAKRGQLYLQVDDLKADNVMLRSRLRQAKELIDEVASQCPEENDWLDVARRWLAAEIGGK
jgi:chromosome segregation ATPase